MFAAHKFVTDAAGGGLDRLATLRERQDREHPKQFCPVAQGRSPPLRSALPVNGMVLRLAAAEHRPISANALGPMPLSFHLTGRVHDLHIALRNFVMAPRKTVVQASNDELVDSRTDKVAANQFDMTAKLALLKFLCERYSVRLQPS